MKKITFISILLVTFLVNLLTNCTSEVDPAESFVAEVSLLPETNIDSIIHASDSVAFSIKYITKETDSALKKTIGGILYKNHLLQQKSLLVSTITVRDTVFIVDTYTKNIWGKTQKTRKTYVKSGVVDTVSTLLQDDIMTATDSCDQTP